MECWIYKGTRRDETYLYLAAPDDTSPVPDALLHAMGTLQLVMNITLSAQRPLARVSAEKVMQALATQGYYLQMPPVDTPGHGRLQ